MRIARLASVLAVVVVAAGLALASTALAGAPLFLGGTTKFTGTSGTSILLANNSAEEIRCEKDNSSGEITGALSVGNVFVHFLNCSGTSEFGKIGSCPVESPNAPTINLIITNTLIGRLGLILPIPSSGSDVGLLLLPASGKVFVTVTGNTATCVPTTKVSGLVAGLVLNPLNALALTGTLDFQSALSGSANVESITDIDPTEGSLVTPELVAFGASASEGTTEALSFAKDVEVM